MAKLTAAPAGYPELGAIIRRVQSRFIRAASTPEVFDPLLTDLLEFTSSEYGFIAEVLCDPGDGHRFLRICVLTDISWNYVTRTMYERHRTGEQVLEFHNLKTLFGAAITSGAPVIANDPASDPRCGGLPGGHPAMDSFLGVPLFHGGDMVGMVGLANRPGGFDESLVDFLQPLFASVGAIIGAVHMEQARRLAERALRESEARLRTTFEMAAVGIAHVSPDGEFLRVNRRLCEILGHPRETLLRLRIQDVTLPEDLATHNAQTKQLIDGESSSYTTEGRYLHSGGGTVWCALSAALVRDRTGAPHYFISVIENITARKRSEAALLAAQAAERANAAKTEFLSRMSHELRTPLNAVLGFAQLLQMDSAHPLTPQQHSRVHHIENAGTHLLAMINDVLDLSRIESGSMPVLTETVALPTALDEAFALVATAASEAGVELRHARPADDGGVDHVRADHLRLRQVLVNLLSNAIKYNRTDGSVTAGWRTTADGRAVHLQVSDTGRGLSAEQRAHLFEPFNRLGAESSGIEGTGIGLVVTQRLVHLMGGAISVESTPGSGSCFTVELPAALPSDAQPAGSAAGDAAAPTRGACRTLLYAEDNPMNVELVREVLSLRTDLRLVIARNGREALMLARREPPDLLLLDMHLGDMTGLDVKKQLSRDPALADLPCVILSADAMPAPIRAAAGAGIKAYLTKPLAVGMFLRCIDDIFADAAHG